MEPPCFRPLLPLFITKGQTLSFYNHFLGMGGLPQSWNRKEQITNMDFWRGLCFGGRRLPIFKGLESIPLIPW